MMVSTILLLLAYLIAGLGAVWLYREVALSHEFEQHSRNLQELVDLHETYKRDARQFLIDFKLYGGATAAEAEHYVDAIGPILVQQTADDYWSQTFPVLIASRRRLHTKTAHLAADLRRRRLHTGIALILVSILIQAGIEIYRST